MPRGKDKRCEGYTSLDGKWAFCARVPSDHQCANGLWRHLLKDTPLERDTSVRFTDGGQVPPRITAIYDYCDELGALAYQVVRYEPKAFKQRRGEGVWSVAGVAPSLYRLPELLADDGDRPVYIVEGEKDVDALEALGFTATCNSGGAGKWGPVAELARKHLAGREVIVVADRDGEAQKFAGQKHARDVAESLKDAAASVKTVYAGKFKDVGELFEAGGTLDDLEPMDLSEAAAMPFKIWTEDEIYAPLPPIDWVVQDLIPKGTITLIAAYGASLKSWVRDELEASINQGRPFLGLFPVVGVGPTLLIDFENGAYEIRRRKQAIARAGGKERIAGTHFVSMPGMGLDTPEFLVHLRELARKYKLITIDTLAAGSSGDENDARFAAPLKAMKAIAEETGCAFVVLHHTRKSKEGDDDRETTRGSGAIFNALDIELKLFRVKDSEAFMVKQTKARVSKACKPFVVTVTDLEEGKTVVSAVWLEDWERLATGLQPNPGDALMRAKAAILELLKGATDIRSKNEVFRRLKGGPNKKGVGRIPCFDALEELMEREIVISYRGTLRLQSECQQ